MGPVKAREAAVLLRSACLPGTSLPKRHPPVLAGKDKGIHQPRPYHVSCLGHPPGEGLYYGSFQANRMVQGGAWTDNVKKNSRKLWYAAHKKCLQEGFTYVHMVTPLELAKDEELKAVWEVMAGGEANSSESASYDGTTTGRTNKVRRLFQFSAEESDDFERCISKPKGESPW